MNEFLKRDEALGLLGIKAATLYTYVSKGLIQRIRCDKSQQSLYSTSDINRLALRRRGRLGRAAAAETAMHWGEPVINTSLTALDPAGPRYRGMSAITLAKMGTAFESAADFLMTGTLLETLHWPLDATSPDRAVDADTSLTIEMKRDLSKAVATNVLKQGAAATGRSIIASNAPPQHAGDDLLTARHIIETISSCMSTLAGRPIEMRNASESTASFLIRAGGGTLIANAVKALNAALVLCMDHELAAATFVARIAVSSGADLYNAIAAALCVHAGSAIGTVAVERIEEYLLTEGSDLIKLESISAFGTERMGFNHPLYISGDPRADFILSLAEDLAPNPIFSVLRTAQNELHSFPGIAVALTVLAHTLNLPHKSAELIWLTARSGGWLAHCFEQRSQKGILRPRAKYTVAVGE